jgi:hypothetical protein
MVYHAGANEDGTCQIGTANCTWGSGQGEGGYHYSLFALSKGLGQYEPSNPADPANFYAKVVDLLLSEQNTDGSWPNDPRDDGSQVGATAFAIMSLGRVGQPANASGVVFNDKNANGARDAGEPGLPGWTAYADLNGNGARDSGEPSSVSGSDGAYKLQNLPEGKGTIREVPQSGWNCTKPSGCAYPSVEFSLGANITGLDFGDNQGAVAGQTSFVCGSRRNFVIHPRIRTALRRLVRSVTVNVNGTRVRAVKRNGRWQARVDLRGLKANRYSVQITVRLKNGRTLKGTRRYFTCHAPRQSGPPRL